MSLFQSMNTLELIKIRLLLSKTFLYHTFFQITYTKYKKIIKNRIFFLSKAAALEIGDNLLLIQGEKLREESLQDFFRDNNGHTSMR